MSRLFPQKDAPGLLHGKYQPIRLLRLNLLTDWLTAPKGVIRPLPCQQRGNALHACHQLLCQLSRLHGCNQPGQCIPIRIQQAKPLLSGGHGVGHTRQYHTLPGYGSVHPTQAVQNGAVLPDHHQIGAATHDLTGKGDDHAVPQLICALKVQKEDPFQSILPDGNEPSPGEMLPQKHAEHGRLCRVIHCHLGHMHPGTAGSSGDQQLSCPLLCAKAQDHRLPGGLIHLVDPPLQQAVNLPLYHVQKCTVQCHEDSPFRTDTVPDPGSSLHKKQEAPGMPVPLPAPVGASPAPPGDNAHSQTGQCRRIGQHTTGRASHPR